MSELLEIPEGYKVMEVRISTVGYVLVKKSYDALEFKSQIQSMDMAQVCDVNENPEHIIGGWTNPNELILTDLPEDFQIRDIMPQIKENQRKSFNDKQTRKNSTFSWR